MEFKTKIKLYSGLLGTLVLTAFLGLFLNAQADLARRSLDPLIPGLGSVSLSSLQVENGPTLRLAADGQWEVLQDARSYPANAERITGFVKSLTELTRLKVVSTGDDLAPFGLVGGFKRLTAQSKDGKEVFNLQIGKATPDEKSVYVKFDKEKTVYATDRGFARSLELDFNTWTDLRLIQDTVAPESLEKMEFKGGLEVSQKKITPYVLVKTLKDNQPVWVAPGSETPIPEAESAASRLATQVFLSYLKPDESFNPEAAVGTLEVVRDRGKVSTFKIGPKDAQNRFPVFDGKRTFWLAEWALEQLLYKKP